VSIGTISAQSGVGGTGGNAFSKTDCAVAIGPNIRAGASADTLG
jgi:hypothetical protein